MSDWLSIALVILIVGFVIDGLRRARNARSSEIRMSGKARKADKMYGTSGAAGSVDGDFPSGGARTKNGDYGPTPGVQSSIPGSPTRQASLELDDPVPMLMDSVVDEDDQVPEDTASHDGEEAYTDPPYEGAAGLAEPNEPSLGALDDLDAVVAPDPQRSADIEAASESVFDKASQHFSNLTVGKKERASAEHAESEVQEQGSEGPREILIINVMARSGTVFLGEALFEALIATKLRFGHMDIFHRHIDNDGDAEIIYSVANIVEPGSFDFANMKNSQTPGVCMFLSLPTACDGYSAFEDLVSTAQTLAEQLDGELKDENRSTLTKQNIEHGRQRVMEFERRNKLKKS